MWRQDVRAKIVAASGVSVKKIWPWIMQIESRSVTFEQLGDDSKHGKLDAKIGAGVQAILHGPIGQELCTKIEQSVKVGGLPI